MPMTPDRWREIEAVYYSAAEQPPTQRAAWLAETCGTDFDLLREVESLLVQRTLTGTTLKRGAEVISAALIRDGGVSLSPGRRMGHYEMLGALGAGAMGEVYRALDTRLGREVAIKILPRAFIEDADRLARFEREARVLASLNHPNIAAIYGVEESDGIKALVLELVPGDTLADRIARSRRRGLPFAEALAIARQITDALDAAHEKGIIHRDLKPANIKITPAGVVKVLDFGLAKLQLVEGAVAPSRAPTITVGGTGDGLIVGTPAYMSPEQARALPIDKRTDIWAFGCVLFEMIAGRAAFARETISDTIAAVLERAPDWSALPGGTPAHVRRLLRRCLEKDLRQRMRDVGDMQPDLEDASTGTQAPIGQPPRGDRFLWPFAAASLAAIAFGVLAIRPQLTGAGGPPVFTRVTQVGGGQASEFAPAISPDGKWIAYLSDARGSTDVWVKFLSGGDPINLTATLPLAIQSRSDLGGLAIAPDGSAIAFDAGATRTTAPADFDAWVIPAPTGGMPRKVVERGRALRWSPDGMQMLFVRPGSSAGDALFVARADGGSPRELVALRGGMHIHWPVWSHDSRYIYFNYTISTANREPASIYRVSVAGGAVEPVVASARRAVFPLPTPDGAGLIYSSNPTSVDLALWWRPHGNSPPTRLTTGVGEYAEASMAADGRTMIATLVQFRKHLATILIAETSASVRPLIDGSAPDIDPVLSPAGDTLVFSSARSGFQNLWTARSDGTMARALTSGNAFDERPAFSPDGRRLAFVSDRSGQRGIWIMSADGGIPEHLVDTPVIDRLLWSPDAGRILYATTVGDVPALHSVSVADGQVQRVATPGPALGAFSFSNDMIGYLEPLPGGPSRPNVNRVAFMRLTGEAIEADALKALNLANGFAVASQDGRRLAAIVEPGGAAGSVWVADLMKRTPFVKVTDFIGDARTRGGTWTSNNDALIVGLIQRTSHLVLFDQAK